VSEDHTKETEQVDGPVSSRLEFADGFQAAITVLGALVGAMMVIMGIIGIGIDAGTTLAAGLLILLLEAKIGWGVIDV